MCFFGPSPGSDLLPVSSAVARNQYERMGGDVTMQCGSLDDDASVSWKVNGTDVKAQHRLEGPRLIIPQGSLSHNGLYSCFQNPHGERRDTIYLHLGSESLPVSGFPQVM